MNTVKIFHNDEEVSSQDVEGLVSVGVYGAQGSRTYEVNATDSLLTIRLVGAVDDTGSNAALSFKTSPKVKEAPVEKVEK